MNNVKVFEFNHNTTKSYATYDGAVKAIQKLVAKRDDQFYMVVIPNDQGRFVPVVLPTSDQMCGIVAFANKGFPVVRV